MAKGTYKSIEAMSKRLKKDLDMPHPEKPSHKKITLIFACNASGKTRLSKAFSDNHEEEVLYYSAFTEDLFNWDNDRCVLKVEPKAWLFQLIGEQGLEKEIIDNFQKFTGSKAEPAFDLTKGEVTFVKRDGTDNIKISRGEESAFIWATFYTVLETAIDALNDAPDKRATKDFDKIKYVLIDDPVSSMDDTRIITVALDLAELISKSNSQLKFLITTHHALFFNVLFNEREKDWDKKCYVLSKEDTDIRLTPQGNESPFAYHHVVISEIKRAIAKNDVRRYHFNLFRTLLEKTANFLGHEHWKKCLQDGEHEKTLIKLIDQYSHNRLADLEPSGLPEDEKISFKEAYQAFMTEHKWGAVANG